MKISFLLPGSGHLPSGGFKIVYEYANRLVERRHQVTLIHPATLERTAIRPRSSARYLKRLFMKSYQPLHWFGLDPRVESAWVFSPRSTVFPQADTVVATYWKTAEWVAALPPEKGRKFYLIQGLETCMGPPDRVTDTWRLPLTKIVIANWLKDFASDLGQKAFLVPNGLDFEAFGLDHPPQQRDPLRIMMLYGEADWKGSQDGIAALKIVKERFPELKTVLFGVPSRPEWLPSWIDYHQRPQPSKLRQLYNETAIFVAPSWTEGWGLTASEALMCGAALVATDVGGHREFAIEGETALVAPIKQPNELAERIIHLIDNSPLRIRLAAKGHAFIQRFTWDRAVTGFIDALYHG